ncbi:MAG: hypothetical protein KIS79_01575 [Burkholderiales bacterium]|nr:hypothetical protein [Burkholderiales bacterium]
MHTALAAIAPPYPPAPAERTRRRRAHTLALLYAVVWLWCGSVIAQVVPAIPEPMLREPWSMHLTLLQSLSERIQAVQPPQREHLADTLATLQVALGEYETQVDHVIDRVLADAQFPHTASEVSLELSQQIADVHGQLAALYDGLGVRERPDVQDAQDVLDALRKTLQARVHFERDVIVGTASRPPRVELATRWWNGEERAIALKKLVAQLRKNVEGLPD